MEDLLESYKWQSVSTHLCFFVSCPQIWESIGKVAKDTNGTRIIS